MALSARARERSVRPAAFCSASHEIAPLLSAHLRAHRGCHFLIIRRRRVLQQLGKNCRRNLQMRASRGALLHAAAPRTHLCFFARSRQPPDNLHAPHTLSGAAACCLHRQFNRRSHCAAQTRAQFGEGFRAGRFADAQQDVVGLQEGACRPSFTHLHTRALQTFSRITRVAHGNLENHPSARALFNVHPQPDVVCSALRRCWARRR